MRRTEALIKVVEALMTDPDAPHYGYPLGKSAGVRSGVLYPTLSRLLGEGWLADGWEDATVTRSESRPPRRYYTVTPAGLAAMTELVREGQR